MKKILIIGLGLIGGSIALGIKRTHPEHQIIGYDKKDVQNLAKTLGIIDESIPRLEQIQEIDVIILAAPIDVTLEILGQLSQLKLKKDVIITDTGSTKSRVMERAIKVFHDKNVKFIGGHPMAGSHKSGILASDVNLFENAYYVLTEENAELQEILSGLHAKFIILNPEEHDKITGQVSHFPHILASSLVQQSDDYSKEHPLVKNLAAGGFRDMTRIAEADSTMWTAVLLSNPEPILNRIKDFKTQLDEISEKISLKDEKAIKSFFDTGKKIRQGMEIHKGAIPNFYDLFISVPDEKGVILRVLALLQDISITNIKINEENREDIHGQLQISFKTEKDLVRAREIIEFATDFKVA
ncbi:prephenate dehydrogenase [Lactococcus protaetiae]|uniref:Prephenate dehydrogenase n=1 Tax=Lactococcus protaetiae TaxID=2592653 RepID=A0A514ZAU9_9LACT|nr:prephenate dehydrogenase [Lactococcus protaetiae]MCL2112890.1 prephenate dehydrogenase [Streptococcaceae bacterium]QDK71708.1 prephenate dehydrogenase [Lactococcus protaetiae]